MVTYWIILNMTTPKRLNESFLAQATPFQSWKEHETKCDGFDMRWHALSHFKPIYSVSIVTHWCRIFANICMNITIWGHFGVPSGNLTWLFKIYLFNRVMFYSYLLEDIRIHSRVETTYSLCVGRINIRLAPDGTHTRSMSHLSWGNFPTRRGTKGVCLNTE